MLNDVGQHESQHAVARLGETLVIAARTHAHVAGPFAFVIAAANAHHEQLVLGVVHVNVLVANRYADIRLLGWTARVSLVDLDVVATDVLQERADVHGLARVVGTVKVGVHRRAGKACRSVCQVGVVLARVLREVLVGILYRQVIVCLVISKRGHARNETNLTVRSLRGEVLRGERSSHQLHAGDLARFNVARR